MKDVSIEYAHIYTNNRITEEQALSLEILGEVQKEGSGSTALLVMVDDYSFPNYSFDYGTLAAWLTERGFEPDAMFRESELVPMCDEVMALVKDINLKYQLTEYVRTKRYPCSLFIATWYLLRLGAIQHQLFDSGLIAKRIINILPSRFIPFEEKAVQIIESTSFSGETKNIENRYFADHLVMENIKQSFTQSSLASLRRANPQRGRVLPVM